MGSVDDAEVLEGTRFAVAGFRKSAPPKKKHSRKLELVVETKFYDRLKDRGIVAVKLNLRSRRHFPDRMILLPFGRTVFIEFKRPGEEPRAAQLSNHRWLRSLGHIVGVFDNADEAEQFIDQVIISDREHYFSGGG